MRAMIVAAGRGTRLRPLSDLRPKPALPIRGIPLIGYTLAWLSRHGVTEVVVNVHHLPDVLVDAARRHCPQGLALRFSREDELLDTGGGIRRVADFLRASDPCLIVGGDMLLDFDLSRLIEHHHARGDAWTMLLGEGDDRAAAFGTIGVDREDRLRRIGDRFDLGGATRSGVYTWANAVAARAFDTLPDREVFSHLDDWLAPRAAAGATDVGALVAPADTFCWLPVGTPAEYLAANLELPPLSFRDAVAGPPGQRARVEGDVVIGAGARVEPGARLRRVVVWAGERVPADLDVHDGVFADGAFHACATPR